MSESLTNDTIRVYWDPIESELVTKYWCILSTQRAYWDEVANNISPTSTPSFWTTEEAIYDHDDVITILNEIDALKNNSNFNGFIDYKSALNVSGGNGSGDLSGKFVIDFEDTNIINQPYYIYVIAERISSDAFTTIPNNVAGVVDISETLPPPTANAKYLEGEPASFYLSFANMTDMLNVDKIYDFENIVNGMIEAASGTAAEITYDDTNMAIVSGTDVQAAISSIDVYLDNLELQTMNSNIPSDYLFKSGLNGNPIASTNTDTEINNAVIHSNITSNNPHNVLKSDIIKSGSYIVNDDIDFNAGILGTKINPDFGNLNIKTTGNVILGDSSSPSYVNSNLLNVDGDAYISGVLKDANSKNVSILDLSNGLDKLGTIESYADKTDATNVAAAGAVMYNDDSTALMNFVIDEDTMVSNLDTKVPTQQSVKAYVDGVVASSINYRGGYDANTNTPDLDTAPSGISKGDMYTVTVAGTFFTAGVEVGDVLISEIDNPTLESDWTIVNKNLDDASIKVAYENNPDTNAFTDVDVNKLNGIESNAKDLTIHNIGELADVDTSNVLDGQVLAYNSTLLKYTPITVDSFGGKTLDDLADGSIYKRMTADEQSKLDNLPSNADANVQVDWSVTDTASDSYIKNKPADITDLNLHSIGELNDINNILPGNNNILVYDSIAGKWTPTATRKSVEQRSFDEAYLLEQNIESSITTVYTVNDGSAGAPAADLVWSSNEFKDKLALGGAKFQINSGTYTLNWIQSIGSNTILESISGYSGDVIIQSAGTGSELNTPGSDNIIIRNLTFIPSISSVYLLYFLNAGENFIFKNSVITGGLFSMVVAGTNIYIINNRFETEIWKNGYYSSLGLYTQKGNHIVVMYNKIVGSFNTALRIQGYDLYGIYNYIDITKVPDNAPGTHGTSGIMMLLYGSSLGYFYNNTFNAFYGSSYSGIKLEVKSNVTDNNYYYVKDCFITGNYFKNTLESIQLYPYNTGTYIYNNIISDNIFWQNGQGSVIGMVQGSNGNYYITPSSFYNNLIVNNIVLNINDSLPIIDIPDDVILVNNIYNNSDMWYGKEKYNDDKFNIITSIHDTAPTINDDITAGYLKGNLWFNSTTNYMYICIDNASGSASWIKIII